MPSPGIRRVALLIVAMLLAGCATRPLVVVSPVPESHAWWLRAAFEPRGDRVRGLPVRAVHADWCAIDELTPGHFAAFDPAADPSAARYALPGPGVDGRAKVALLAVFRTCTGDTGTALLLVDAVRAGAPLAVEVVATPAHYAMLQPGPSGELHVVFCQECDHATTYAWDTRLRRLVELPAPDDLP